MVTAATVKTITVGQLRQDPTAMLDEVEAGEVYRVTRHDREIARIVPRDPAALLLPRRRWQGSDPTGLERHELTTATSIEQLLDRRAGPSTSCCLDTSMALHALLGHSRTAASWVDEVSADARHRLISSRLVRTELTRVLRRERLPVRRSDLLLDVVSLIPLTDGVLAAAEALEPHVRTLDAVHLGSVIAAGTDAVIVTHDRTMGAAAEALGHPVHDPVAHR